MKRIFITHCSREKNPVLEASGAAATPEELYTSSALQAFIRFCKARGYDWAILSDRYGVVFADEPINWYSKPPDTVTGEEFGELLRSFTTRLAGYDEILFQHRPGETHAVFKRIVEKAVEFGMNVIEFPVEDMDEDDQTPHT